ncbi:MAG: RNA-binding S4 domain-containing protein [Clostridia bacterium]|nr:RNA-binding S4 domain-containing protein [Clostridia bacterium]
MNFEKISIKEEFIRLDSAMKLANLVVTGGHAKIVIQDGEVTVNGEVCTMRGKKLHKGDKVTFDGQGFEIV